MQQTRCISCMQEIEPDTKICPHCGRDQEIPQPDNALRRFTVLRGRYLVGNMIGKGGFGITYVGMDLTLEMKVAIKEYYPTGMATRLHEYSNEIRWNTFDPAWNKVRDENISRFLKEARRMAKLDDVPGVVRVRDVFKENGTAYIVMDFVEGENLKKWLMANGVMSCEECLKLLMPIVDSLAIMHDHGFIHRDIAPDNIMIRPDGSARLLDMGAVVEMSANNGQASMIVVKNNFSAPEQYGETSVLGPYTDVYSMAATLYYCMTGKLVESAMDRVMERKPVEFPPQIPPQVAAALEHALEISEKERTPDMRTFRQELGEPPYGRVEGTAEEETGTAAGTAAAAGMSAATGTAAATGMAADTGDSIHKNLYVSGAERSGYSSGHLTGNVHTNQSENRKPAGEESVFENVSVKGELSPSGKGSAKGEQSLSGNGIAGSEQSFSQNVSEIKNIDYSVNESTEKILNGTPKETGERKDESVGQKDGAEDRDAGRKGDAEDERAGRKGGAEDEKDGQADGEEDDENADTKAGKKKRNGGGKGRTLGVAIVVILLILFATIGVVFVISGSSDPDSETAVQETTTKKTSSATTANTETTAADSDANAMAATTQEDTSAAGSASGSTSAGYSGTQKVADDYVAYFTFDGTLADETGNYKAVAVGYQLSETDKSDDDWTYVEGTVNQAIAINPEGVDDLVGLNTGIDIGSGSYTVAFTARADSAEFATPLVWIGRTYQSIESWNGFWTGFENSENPTWNGTDTGFGSYNTSSEENERVNAYASASLNDATESSFGWTSIAFSVNRENNSVVTVYYGGVKVAEASNAAELEDIALLYIGANCWDTPCHFFIDELYVYDRVLSQEEISAIAEKSGLAGTSDTGANETAETVSASDGAETTETGETNGYVDGTGGNENEDPWNLFDLNAETKWCTSFPTEEGNDGIYVIWQTDEAVSVRGYVITTGNDTAEFQGRNPKSWTLYGCSQSEAPDRHSDAWEVIDQVTDDNVLEAVNFTSYEYYLDGDAPEYNYYMLVVTEITGGDVDGPVFQLSEFNLIYDYCYYYYNGEVRGVGGTAYTG